MNRICYLVIIIDVLSFGNIYSQAELNNIDLLNQKKSKAAIEYLGLTTTNENFMVYHMSDKILVVVAEDDGYHLVTLSISTDATKIVFRKERCEFIKESTILEQSFIKQNKVIKIYSGEKHVGISYVYFLLNYNGTVQVEFNLPAITYTKSNRDFKYPIKKELMEFLTSKILSLY